MGYIAEKKLEDGTILKLKSWVSDTVRPGKIMYQLELIDVGSSMNFPTDYENYSKSQIEEMFSNIRSKADFEKIIKEVKGRL